MDSPSKSAGLLIAWVCESKLDPTEFEITSGAVI